MATKATNDGKRAEMRALVRSTVEDDGWTYSQLAVVFNVSISTISAWARGRSMGTNAQRIAMRRLRPVAEERLSLRSVAAALRACAADLHHAARARLLERAAALEAM